MNEKLTEPKIDIRPTKKQRELLTFIETFIAEHGYSPSYREIMTGLNYTSVATVAVHVNNLIARGHLSRRDRSARSLEVVASTSTIPQPATKLPTNQIAPAEEKWLIQRVEHAFNELENMGGELAAGSVDQLYVLVGALKVLGFDGASQSFSGRLAVLKKRQTA